MARKPQTYTKVYIKPSVEHLKSMQQEYKLRTLKDAETLHKYFFGTSTSELPIELFWYIQGYCGAIGGCAEVILTAIAAWLNRKPKNKFDSRLKMLSPMLQ